MLRFVHLTFSSQSRISIITFCRGPVRGRKVRHFSPSLFIFRLPSAILRPPFPARFSSHVGLFSARSAPCIFVPRRSFPRSLPVARSPFDLHSWRYVPRHRRLESGKFLMGYYGVQCMPTGFIPTQHASKPPPPCTNATGSNVQPSPPRQGHPRNSSLSFSSGRDVFARVSGDGTSGSDVSAAGVSRRLSCRRRCPANLRFRLEYSSALSSRDLRQQDSPTLLCHHCPSPFELNLATASCITLSAKPANQRQQFTRGQS